MRVFITGVVGSLGTELAKLHKAGGDEVFGCARNESKAVEWLAEHGKDATLFIGDCSKLACQAEDMGRLLPSIDRLYHCAAMKHVDLCEANPEEAFRQNVTKTWTVSKACAAAKVPFVFISSDKACLPQGVYGATKLMGERIAARDGGAAVRFGNLIGSSGSVFRLWGDAIERSERIKLTDPEMTRYFMTTSEAAQLASRAACWGRTAVPAGIKAVRMGDVAEDVAGSLVDVVGRRAGETRHQWLLAPGDRAILDAELRFWTLGEGSELDEGACSKMAPRWDVEELLKVAGV